MLLICLRGLTGKVRKGGWTQEASPNIYLSIYLSVCLSLFISIFISIWVYIYIYRERDIHIYKSIYLWGSFKKFLASPREMIHTWTFLWQHTTTFYKTRKIWMSSRSQSKREINEDIQYENQSPYLPIYLNEMISNFFKHPVRTSGDHPNYHIIENGQKTEKSPGDLRRLTITSFQRKTTS